MDCGIPFCHQGCPLGNIIPEWNDLVWRDDWEGAIERLHATNNFPEFTGRLCPAPCETACVLGINQDPVTIKNVEVSIIDRAWESGLVRPQPPEWLSGRTVAVIGSGPAGLAAAQQLTRAGHTVAVYERADKIGGLLRYGIPEFKMEKKHLDRRVDQMRREGTVFRAGVDVGDRPHRRPAARALRRRRARHRRDRGPRPAGPRPRARRHPPGDGVPAAGQPRRARRGGRRTRSPPTGKHVVIIGGGDTGADCLGTSHRQGARLGHAAGDHAPAPATTAPTGQPWPTYPMIFRVSSAHEEGGERVYAVSTQEFLGDERRQRPGAAAGRRGSRTAVPAESPGTEREIPAELVLFAMGFTGPEQRRPGRAARRRPRRARQRRPRRGVRHLGARASSSAGDAGRGQSLIVWAIAEGRAAAAAVDAYLTGSTTLPRPIPPTERPLVV